MSNTLGTHLQSSKVSFVQRAAARESIYQTKQEGDLGAGGRVIIELDYQLGDSVKVLGKQEPAFDWVLSESGSNLVTRFLGSLCL